MAEHVAIYLAQERRRGIRREEEEMTGYGHDELEQSWEFKILRSPSGAFRSPRKLAKVLAEESLAGWTLLEKFDNQRIRLKRLASARQQDNQLPAGYDPYRTQFGLGEGALTAYWSFGIVALIAGVSVLILWLTGSF